MSNIIDFNRRLKLVATKETDEELNPLKEIFDDAEIMNVFVSVLMMIRLVSISETIAIKIADDQIFLESKNYLDHKDEQVESAVSLTRIASMFVIDDNGELLEQTQLVSNFQAMLEAVMDDEEINE